MTEVGGAHAEAAARRGGGEARRLRGPATTTAVWAAQTHSADRRQTPETNSQH